MSLFKNKKWWATTLVAGALLLQTLPSGCRQYYANAAMSAFDWCSLFNCEGGTYFDLCNPVPLLLSCPTQVTTTQ